MTRTLPRAAVLARLEPALRGIDDRTLPARLPAGELTVDEVRSLDAALIAAQQAPTPGCTRIERIDGGGGRTIELRMHEAAAPGAVVLWIHGGGMFLGSARRDDGICRALSTDLGVSVASVDYRLAPEHPHPEPLEDCYAALEWLAGRYPTIVVAGASAGGGLAAGLALLARDRSGPPIAALHLYYPMLDDRGSTTSAHALADTVVWNRRLDRLAWRAYLGRADADGYAAPARAVDLSGLPPTVIDTGDLDLFVDEDVEFAGRLRDAGVEVRLTVEPDAPHCFEFIVPDAPRSLAVLDRRRAALAADLRSGARA